MSKLTKDEQAYLDALPILEALISQRKPLPDKASPATRAVCFGVARYYFRLTAILDHLMKKRPKDQDIWLLLLMGIFQLYTRATKDYAIVNTMVPLTVHLKKPWAKSLVNAVLRNYCRQRNQIQLHTPAFLYNHPQWMIDALQAAWPNQWQQILQQQDQLPPMTLRYRQAKVLERLKANDFQTTPGQYAPHAIILDTPCDVHSIPGFDEGSLTVQDEAAQLAVSLLDLAPGQRVLDACCAPGGKTAHILDEVPDLSFLLALDKEKKRLGRVNDNLNRLGLKAVVKAADATTPEVWWDGQPFDRILLDAPCSATGVIRRHPDIKLCRTAKQVKTLCDTQAKLLNALWTVLKPGGRLVYATCSILPEENADQVQTFLDTHPDAKHIPIDTTWGHSCTIGRQIFPGDDNMDGFYYAVLVKQA